MNALKSALSVRDARGIFVLMFLFEASLLSMSAHYVCQKFCGLCGYVPNEQLPDWVGLSVSPLVLLVLITSIQFLHDSLEGEIRFADDELRVESVVAPYVRWYRHRPAFVAPWEHLQVRTRPYGLESSKVDRMEYELVNGPGGKVRRLILSHQMHERFEAALREKGVRISEW